MYNQYEILRTLISVENKMFGVFDKFRNHLEDKLREIEEDMDEDEIPPWFGEKERSSSAESSTEEDTSQTTSGNQTVEDTFTVTEEEDEVILEVELPGYPKESLDVSRDADDDFLRISAEETENRQSRTYKYELPFDADVASVNAEYEYGVLTVTIPRN